ncbi:MAG TPA: hypothetical protein VGJ37_00340 [Pyrinomonadaceae bacterium]|jgi:hypothetical protein
MKLDDEIDALFRLPLAEFTSSRNALASRLKKDGRQNDAERVKLLTKPSISAWTVNQLYWDHRDAFNQLIATGKRFRSAPASRTTSKAANMRDSLDARREALANLSDLASELLTDAGHSPTTDTIRRITTTLEALSAYALLGDGPIPGRLTNDVDPPSFEALASLMSGGLGHAEEPALSAPSRKSGTTAASNTQQKPPTDDARKIRQAKIAAAKVSLQDAKRSLTDARARAQSLEGQQKKVKAEAREAESDRREAEARLEKATAASEAAARRAQSTTDELEEAAQTVEDAKRAVEEATKELESLLRGSP